MKVRKLNTLAVMFAIALVGSGCSDKLRNDPAPSAVSSDYPTAEEYVAGRLWHGGAVTDAEKGKKWSEVKLQLQTYHKGKVEIKSGNCPTFDQSYPYKGSPLLNLQPKTGDAPVSKSCLITVTLRPEYDIKVTDGVVVYNQRGHYLVKATNGEAWQGAFYKVLGDTWRRYQSIKIAEADFARVVMNGCGATDWRKTINAREQVGNYYIDLPLHEITTGVAGRPCVLDGYLVTSEGEEILISTLIAKYKAGFTPLPFPAVTEKDSGKKLQVVADRVVSIVSLNRRFKIDSHKEWDKYNSQQYNIVRAWTNKGRTALCQHWKDSLRWTCYH